MYKPERPSSNININDRDQELIRTREGIRDLVDVLTGRKKAGRQDTTPGFSVAPPFKPAMSVSDLMNPDVIYPKNWNGAPSRPTVPQVGPRQDPVSKIMQELQTLLQSGGSSKLPQFDPIELPTFDPNRFKNQAEQTVSGQFDPIINEIIAQQGATQKRAATNKTQVGSMYSGLANSLNQDAVTTGQQYDSSQAESKKLYEDERSRIAAGYAADAAAQRAEAKKLGIENLGVEQQISQQSADQRFADQLGSQQMQSSQTAMEQQQRAAQDYDTAIANATRSEGIEAQGDIARQLEDYMMQSNAGLAETRSQKAGSITDLMMKLAQATYDRDVSNTQFGYQQQRDYIGDQNALYDRELDMKMAQLKAAQELASMQGSSSGQGDAKLNPWQQVANFAESLRPGQGSQIVGALQGAMNERPEIWARSKDNDAGVEMNPALFAKLIADSQSAQGIDRNALMQVANELYRLYYGMG